MDEDKADEEEDSDLQTENIEKEVTEVVVADAIVDPGAMMVVFSDTAAAATAVLAAQGFADHALYAETFFIELP